LGRWRKAAKRSHSCVAMSALEIAKVRENGVEVMTLFKRGEPADLDNPTESAVEAEIRDFVRRDVAMPRRSLEADGEAVANNISTLLQRVAGSTVAEIDRLTSELRSLRELLQGEGARVQREITGYARLSQSAMQSTKVISEKLADWRSKDARAHSG
jgi:hypothetical protein